MHVIPVEYWLMYYCSHLTEEEHRTSVAFVLAKNCQRLHIGLHGPLESIAFILVNAQHYFLRFDLKNIHIWMENGGKIKLNYPECEDKAEKLDA